MANALFYLMAFGVITLSLGVILSKNPVKAVLSLLGTFFCLATIYLLAGFQFMAAAQILVYAGAIMVLFLFVIMLLNLGDDTREKLLDTQLLKSRGLTMALAVTSGGLGAVLLAIGSKSTNVPHPGQPAEGIGSPDALATALFLAADMHHLMIGAVLSSYDILPVSTDLVRVAHLGEAASSLGMRMLDIAVQLAAPGLLVTFSIDLLLALVGRAMGQVPILFVGYPVKLAAGLIAMAMLAMGTGSAIGWLGRTIVQDGRAILGALSSQGV